MNYLEVLDIPIHRFLLWSPKYQAGNNFRFGMVLVFGPTARDRTSQSEGLG